MKNVVPISCCLILGFSLCVFGISSCTAEQEKTRAAQAKALQETTIEAMKHGIYKVNVQFP